MVEKTEALQKELPVKQNEIAGIKEHTKVTIGDLKTGEILFFYCVNNVRVYFKRKGIHVIFRKP